MSSSPSVTTPAGQPLAAARSTLSTRDLLSATLIVVIWGSNFVVMKVGLHDIGPMLLGALRFAAASLPLLLFVPKPSLPWRYIAGYGLTQGLGQFGLLFLAMWLELPAGIASIVLQTQAFFTVILAVLLLQERAAPTQWLGLIVSAVGLALIAAFGRAGVGHVPLAGFVLALAAAFMWASSNIVVRLAQRQSAHYDPLALVVWGSVFPVLPFLLLALWQDGWSVTTASLVHIRWQGVAAVLYLAGAATLVAYSMWARLIKRHSVGKIAPFSLLVPVVGLYAAWLAFAERLTTLQWVGVAIVGSGLMLNNFGHLLRRALKN